MWLLTTFGFFSVVLKPGDEDLTVRSRVREDLNTLRKDYLPEMGETVEGGGTDYRYRAMVDRESMAAAMGNIVRDLDYSNFKNAVSDRQGYERSRAYGNVWGDLYKLQREE